MEIRLARFLPPSSQSFLRARALLEEEEEESRTTTTAIFFIKAQLGARSGHCAMSSIGRKEGFSPIWKSHLSLTPQRQSREEGGGSSNDLTLIFCPSSHRRKKNKERRRQYLLLLIYDIAEWTGKPEGDFFSFQRRRIICL